MHPAARPALAPARAPLRAPALVPALVPVLAAGGALLAGCSTPTPAPSTSPSSASSAVSTSSAVLATKQITMTCKGSGALLVKEVAVGNLGDELLVAWSGSGSVDVSTSFLVAVTVTDPQTGVTRIAGRKVLAQGQPPVQYVFDLATTKNRSVPVSPQGDVARYPGALAGMSPRWTVTATAEADGATIATCTPPKTPATTK